MKEWFDEYGRIHDKPTQELVPSSNNGWLYSAIAKKVGVPISINKEAIEECCRALTRHPHIFFPPMSRDEILGLAYLGFLKNHHIPNWNFSPLVLPKFNIVSFIKELIQCWGEHRNYFWQKNLLQVGYLAFMVPLQDRYFIQKCWGQYNIIYHGIHLIYSFFKKTNKSSRQIHYLKTGKDIQGVIDYYKDEEHPIVQKAKELI